MCWVHQLQGLLTKEAKREFSPERIRSVKLYGILHDVIVIFSTEKKRIFIVTVTLNQCLFKSQLVVDNCIHVIFKYVLINQCRPISR